jgi:hypothetical protein
MKSIEATLNNDILATYLNDHLAGSIAALELVDRLVGLSEGDRQQLFVSLKQEIEEDQRVVKQLLASVGGKESKLRKAAAWLTEKIGEAKLEFDDSGNGQLRLLEALETLGLGIQGKAGLWRALGAASTQEPEIAKLDLARLERRAYDQFERVEARRLEVARAAFGL